MTGVPNYTDQQLEGMVASLQSSIHRWAEHHDLWIDCGFAPYQARADEEPSITPVVTVLQFDGPIGRAMDGEIDGLDLAFSELLERHGYCHERIDSSSIHIYPLDENPLLEPFLDYARWQWICGLVRPDIADVFEELYVHFAARPDDLYRLNPRQFEILLFRIFQNQGFESELGPGRGDGGIDVRLLQRDTLGDMLTLVQAERYAPHNKIKLGPVQALHGAADVEEAQRSLFVTTSDYLPSARIFAARTKIPMTLATSQDVAAWCRDANDGIVRDKSKLVDPVVVGRLLVSLLPGDPRILHAQTGYNIVTNAFAVVLKETRHAALLLSVPRHTVSDDGHGQMGFEVPDIGPRCLAALGPGTVYRAERLTRDGRAYYYSSRGYFGAWDGRSKHFNLCD